MTSEAFNEDNMEVMARYPDKYFDWAIDDPMYDLPDNYLIPGSGITSHGIKRGNRPAAYKLAKQPIVGMNYYNELCRVSKNQIIWGINYFEFAGKVCGRIVWDKVNDHSTFSNCDIASISSIKGSRIFRYMWNGMLQEDMKNKEVKIHPFQKPIALYSWIFRKFIPEGGRIFSPHLGSGSDRIAAYMAENIQFTGSEIDFDCFASQEKRFANFLTKFNQEVGKEKTLNSQHRLF